MIHLGTPGTCRLEWRPACRGRRVGAQGSAWQLSCPLSPRIQENSFLICILVVASVFWVHRLVKFIYNICCYWEIHSFYINALKIPMVGARLGGSIAAAAPCPCGPLDPSQGLRNSLTACAKTPSAPAHTIPRRLQLSAPRPASV